MRPTRSVLACLLAGSLLAGCSLLGSTGAERRSDGGPAELDPAVSMTASGIELAESAGLAASAPRYDVSATVRPESGGVAGVVHADLPVPASATEVRLRYFAGLPAFEAKPTIGEVRADGEPARAVRADSIVTVDLPAGHGSRILLDVPFSYTLPMSEAGGALDGLLGMGDPTDIGLLSRHEHVVNLGHWFPLWVPEGNSAEPDPDGFGDIGNFPAAAIRLELSAPTEWTVVDGGVRVDEEQHGDETTVVSEGVGMRDLVVSLVRGYTSKERQLEGALSGVTVTAHGPEAAAAELDGVLDETAAALSTLSSSLLPYPWKEYDVVAAPLGSGVAGMEWPGATWIESGLFAGGIPGLGGLEGLEGLEELLGDDTLEGLGGLLGGGGGDLGLTLSTMRSWTIAHEVGHEWWHIIVGNDSILDPVVDEPLAQYSACLVLRASLVGSEKNAVCRAHIETGYSQARTMGAPDGAAHRPTDEFESSMQYSGVVYGKAAAFYTALEDEFGTDAVVGALGEVAEANAFTMISGEDLRDDLAANLGDPGKVEALWQRWMLEAHGDEDLRVAAQPSGSGGDQQQLDELFGSLLDALEEKGS